MVYISAFPVIISTHTQQQQHSPPSTTKSPCIFPRKTPSPSSNIERLARPQDNTPAPTPTLPPSAFESESEPPSLFLSRQLKGQGGQLAYDVWLLGMAVFVITTIEASHFSHSTSQKTSSDALSYSVFHILFEVVSAYGCVGLSVGLPDRNYSFCGGWHGGSKLLLCLVMIRGRHRGLSAPMDHAVCLHPDGVAKEIAGG